MSYKNDSLLVISNKFGAASSDAKADLFVTYDKIRDLTVSGSASAGTGLGTASGFFVNLARIIAPSSFMPVLGNQSIINIPGTSYADASYNGGSGEISGTTSSFGYDSLGSFPSFPTGGAASFDLLDGIGSFSIDGEITGGAASMVEAVPLAGATIGTASGFSGQNILLPFAGLLSGIGGVASGLAPYLGVYGLGATAAGSIAQGFGGSLLSMYQSASGKVLNNADVLLSNKVKNIETVVNMLNTQSDVIKKMLKESVEGDSKAIQDL